jgi:hypothetical protein
VQLKEALFESGENELDCDFLIRRIFKKGVEARRRHGLYVHEFLRPGNIVAR